MDQETLEKLKKFCAYQERCHQDVRTKLLKLKVYGDDLEEIMAELIQEGFLDEERYARAYTRGKFRINRWGKVKILQGLHQKNISEYCIKQGLTEIDEEDYRRVLQTILTNRKDQRPKEPLKKTANYAIQKGYESRLVWESLKKE